MIKQFIIKMVNN